MNGRPLTLRITALLLWLGMLTLPAGAAGAPGPIAVLLSDTQDAYTKPVAAFMDEVRRPARLFNLKGNVENAPRVMADLLSVRPTLILALGAKAAGVAKYWTIDRPKLPVIFAMVLNWRQYGLLDGQKNIAGIAFEVAPGTQLASLTLASRRVKRIGVIYSKTHSSETIQQAITAAEKLGLKIIGISIDDPRGFRRAYKKMVDQIDGFWMSADPVAYTLENVNWLKKRCIKDRLVCIGQSRNIAEVGILLAVDPDIANIGRQAASVAKNILLHHQRPEQIGVMPPLGTHLVINAHTADKIGLALDPGVLDLATEIIE